jgi:hypothetical protein
VTRFEAWQPGGELGAAPRNFAMAFDPEGTQNTDESARQRFPREGISGLQAQSDQPQHEKQSPVSEAPAIQTVQAFPPTGQAPAAMVQTILPPMPLDIELPGEPPSGTFNERAGTLRDDSVMTGSHTPPETNSIVQRTEYVEHVIVEHQRPDIDASAAGRQSEVVAETLHAWSSTPPVVEYPERVIIERERLPQEHEPGANVVKSVISSAPVPLAPAQKVEPQLNAEKSPLQHLVVEHVRPEAERVVQPGVSQLPDPAPPPMINAHNVVRPHVTAIVERSEGAPGHAVRDQIDRSGTAQQLQLNPAEFRRPPLAQSPAPTIHVTIGRIEVRAAAPTTPVKRASPPASTMTLEEYLRSRAGDRR